MKARPAHDRDGASESAAPAPAIGVRDRCRYRDTEESPDFVSLGSMSKPRAPQTAVDAQNWLPIVEQALAGDRVAYARLARLVTGHLAHWRAYDFRADWDDIVQEVLLSVVRAYRESRLDAPGALQAYVRQATRFKFIDRIRATKRRAIDKDPRRLGGPWRSGCALAPERADRGRGRGDSSHPRERRPGPART